MGILDKILTQKKAEVASAKKAEPHDALKKKARASGARTRGFRSSLERGPRPVSVIAEIKHKSPSKGVLREPFDPEKLARDLERGGASALSVLTDEPFFGGKLEYLSRIRAITQIPLLRKDFIVDAYQVDESFVSGADALLLIAGILTADELSELHETARSLGLDALVEIHSEDDLKKIGGLKNAVVGINNRDLRTFEVDLGVTERLMSRMPSGHLAVSESGIRNREDLERLGKIGVRAVLVGESLMTQPDPGAALKKLLDGSSRG